MTMEEINAALERSDLQQEHVEVALEIEAELAGAEYEATPDELAAIDEGLAGFRRDLDQPCAEHRYAGAPDQLRRSCGSRRNSA